MRVVSKPVYWQVYEQVKQLAQSSIHWQVRKQVYHKVNGQRYWGVWDHVRDFVGENRA